MFELLVSLTILAGLILFVRLVVRYRKRRREELVDDDVDWNDWEYGSPDDPVPARAKPIEFDEPNKLP